MSIRELSFLKKLSYTTRIMKQDVTTSLAKQVYLLTKESDNFLLNDLVNKCDKYTQYKWESLRPLIGTDNLSDKQKIVDMAKKDMYMRKNLLCQ